MFRREEEPRPTVQDRYYRELWQDALTAKTRLKQKAQDILVKKMAVELYPNGPDERGAKEDLILAKRNLLANIGHYDNSLRKLIDYYRNNSSNFVTMTGFIPSLFKTSHKVVEEVCQEQLFRI